MSIENGGVTHNFESGPTKDQFSSNFLEDFDAIFFSNQYKLAEKKFTEKPGIHVKLLVVMYLHLKFDLTNL